MRLAYQFQGQKGPKISRSPDPLMLTHIVRHIIRTAKPTKLLRTSNLVYGWRTTTRISNRRHDLRGQRSRSYQAYLPNANLRIPLVVVVWRVSWPFPYPFALNSHTASILMRDRNIVTKPNFRNRFLNLEFFRQK